MADINVEAVLDDLMALPQQIRDAVQSLGDKKEEYKREHAKKYLCLKANNEKMTVSALEAEIDADDEIYELACKRVSAEADLEKLTHQFDACRTYVSFQGRAHDATGN